MLVEVETAIWNDSDREVPTNAADGTNAPAEQLFRQNDTAMTDVKHIAENFIMGSVLSVYCRRRTILLSLSSNRSHSTAKKQNCEKTAYEK